MGYALLVLAYLGLIAGCFAFAIFELRRPADPGPLPIDVKRDIDDRHFAGVLRDGGRRFTQAHGMEFSGTNVAVEIRGSLSVAHDEDHPAAYVVRGNGTLGAFSSVEAFVCDGLAVVGEGAIVEKHAEGAAALVIGPGARIEGRATSAGAIRLGAGAEVRFASAPVIVTEGDRSDSAPASPRPWSPDLEHDLVRLLRSGTPLDWALRELSWRTDPDAAPLSGVEALTRAGSEIDDAARSLARSWAPSGNAWYLGAATVRVRGDLELPEGTWVPFHLIVEGSLRAGAGTQFFGGVHAWRDAVLGAGCTVWGSLTARESVSLGARSHVSECVYAGTDVLLDDGTSVGNERSGGAAASGGIVLGSGVLVRGKLQAHDGATVLNRVPV